MGPSGPQQGLGGAAGRFQPASSSAPGGDFFD